MTRGYLSFRSGITIPKLIIAVVSIFAVKILLLFLLNETTPRQTQHINATFANYHYEYQIFTHLSPDRCARTKLFVFLISALSSIDQRNVIRNTWAQEKHVKKSVVVFIVGRPINIEQDMALREEVLQYNDIIETTIPDTYNYTAFKVHPKGLLCP
uniref:Hexosyltransferase n=1 Tax=Steinernema glaseri TaxID=37863 RepID=A0A1I8AG24_9BILA